MKNERVMTELEAQGLAELRLRRPLTPLSTDGEGDTRRKTIEARLVAPLDKMKRQIVWVIKRLEAAKLN